MTPFAHRVAAAAGVSDECLERLCAESLSEVLLVRKPDGPPIVAKSGPAPGTEAAMLRAIAAVGVPAPDVEAEHEDLLLLEHIENDAVFSARAWAAVGEGVGRLHAKTGEVYGWPVDYAIGTVNLDNREASDWPRFWGEQRLMATAALLDRPWRKRVDRLTARLADILPASPVPAMLHGDLWTGNILVNGGRLVGLIDPACYFGDAEVDVAMLELFGSPPEEFYHFYGEREAGWRARRPVYQLFPALVHVRLWGAGYHRIADGLLRTCGF